MEGLSGLGDMMEGVMAQIRQKFKDARQHEGMIESFRAFLAAVDWRVSHNLHAIEAHWYYRKMMAVLKLDCILKSFDGSCRSRGYKGSWQFRLPFF